MTDRAGLAGDTAARYRHGDVELAIELRELERLTHNHARRLTPEEHIERPRVDRDAPRARANEHPRGRGLATSGSVVRIRCWHSVHPMQISIRLQHAQSVSCCGCCALCSCSAPV